MFRRMNAIFKDAFEQIERLSPEAQKGLAAEMERRAYELWLESEVQKGIDAADRGELIPAEQVFAQIEERLKKMHGV